jgi:transposase
MPWLTTNAQEQRARFVTLAAAKQTPISRLCQLFGISRPTGYRWLDRYEQVGQVSQLVEKSRRPHRIPHKASAEIERRILELRDRCGWGARRIANTIARDGCAVARTAVHRILREHGRVFQRNADPASWIVKLLCADDPGPFLEGELLNSETLGVADILKRYAWKDRKKAIAVLARRRKIPFRVIAECLRISPRTVARYIRIFDQQGIAGLFPPKKSRAKNDDECKAVLFSILHRPPIEFGINRTSWKMADLHRILAEQGQHVSEERIRRMIRNSGFKWRKARVVLTSRDPKYAQKLLAIKKILAGLKDDEAFFSIDEYGPFAIKKKGGRKRVAPGEQYIVPQFQKSKGWLILTAALELLRNQVTHFYSRKKNTEEMMRMAETLRDQYRGCRILYLSWDAASWHISKKLKKHLEKLNNERANVYPVVKTAPLPAGAQFLNVIESVFSGMAKAVIHNSDYQSVEEASDAIDGYFDARNAHYASHPARAGQKLWRLERVPCEFSESNNCKDPAYR